MTPPDASSHALPFPGASRPVRSGGRPQTGGVVAQRLRARKRRVAMIRKRVTLLVVVAFLALWTVIFVQLVSGNDPALTRSSAAKTVAVATPATKVSATTTRSVSTPASTVSSSTGSTSSGTTGSSTGAASSGSSAGNATAVTTSQS
jgi:cytoskeletal protein RodZ